MGQLTVYDRLGYSYSDLVVLNVTEYISPFSNGIDPILFIAIAGAIIVFLVVIVVMMKKKGK